MSVIDEMNRLGIKLIENEMEYGHFTPEEQEAIANAIGFMFIKVKYSAKYDADGIYETDFNNGDTAYIIYDSDREEYCSYTDDGWHHSIGKTTMAKSIDDCFDYILEPYVTDYFDNTVLPDIPDKCDTMRSSMVKLLHKITECIPENSDILISILTPGHTNHTVRYNKNKYPMYAYTDTCPNDIYIRYNDIEFQRIKEIPVELVIEILYTLLIGIDHVLIADSESGCVSQIIASDDVKMDEIDLFMNNDDIQCIANTIPEARTATINNSDKFDELILSIIEQD